METRKNYSDREIVLEYDNEVLRNRVRRMKSHQKRKNSLIRKTLSVVTICMLCATVTGIVCTAIINAEKHSSQSKYHLLLGVERNDPVAIERFNKYIENDDYVLNGPKTIKAMADKYGLDYDKLYSDFKESEYETAQEFFNKVVKPMVK